MDRSSQEKSLKQNKETSMHEQDPFHLERVFCLFNKSASCRQNSLLIANLKRGTVSRYKLSTDGQRDSEM